MEYPKGITVYGASRPDLDPAYTAAAFMLGVKVAEAGLPLISGGGSKGLMAQAIEGALSAGGVTIGVLPQFMVARKWQHPGLTEMIATPDMHSRKKMMAELSLGVVAMPGGIGTFEELLEIITWRQLGLYKGQVVILNTRGYYNPLLGMLEQARQQGFMRSDSDSRLWSVTDDPEHAVKVVSQSYKKVLSQSYKL